MGIVEVLGFGIGWIIVGGVLVMLALATLAARSDARLANRLPPRRRR